jgi:hypothetical protein
MERRDEFMQADVLPELVGGPSTGGLDRLWSRSDLLPGMYSTPIHVVPKPHSTKLRLIVDHSAGSYSLNSMIDLSDTAGPRDE